MTEPASTRGTIVVSGTGRVVVDPDIAELRLGVAVSRPNVEAARTAAAEVMTAILASVTAAGVAKRDVRTTLLSVQPRYDYREGKATTLVGYDLANIVEVTVHELPKLGAPAIVLIAPPATPASAAGTIVIAATRTASALGSVSTPISAPTTPTRIGQTIVRASIGGSARKAANTPRSSATIPTVRGETSRRRASLL